MTDRICNPHTHRWDGDWCYTCTAKHPGGRDAFDMALTAAVAECQDELSRTPTSASRWERVAIQSCIDRINALKRPSR